MEQVSKRKLHERSYLTFEFPTKEDKIIKTYIPFLENCKVTENQKSNLAEYSLLGRSGNIYSYLGAKSRILNLNFKITFDHLVTMYSLEGISRRFEQSYRLASIDERDRFFTGANQSNINGINHAELHSEFFNKLTESIVPPPLTNIFTQNNPNLTQTIDPDRAKLINLVIFWLNLVRSSVRNNASNTLYGCPIVRLTHGVMYNNIPCITDSYSINVVEQAGYDLDTVLPKQLEISMILNEHRVGDLTKFESRQIIRGDNIAGWESVISENNMDPYNGIIGNLATPITNKDSTTLLNNITTRTIGP